MLREASGWLIDLAGAEARLHAARPEDIEAELVAIALAATRHGHGALFVWDKKARGLVLAISGGPDSTASVIARPRSSALTSAGRIRSTPIRLSLSSAPVGSPLSDGSTSASTAMRLA